METHGGPGFEVPNAIVNASRDRSGVLESMDAGSTSCLMRLTVPLPLLSILCYVQLRELRQRWTHKSSSHSTCVKPPANAFALNLSAHRLEGGGLRRAPQLPLCCHLPRPLKVTANDSLLLNQTIDRCSLPPECIGSVVNNMPGHRGSCRVEMKRT
eukprot:scaffold224827_cov32-Tisochrysis_lutea.AAC.2